MANLRRRARMISVTVSRSSGHRSDLTHDRTVLSITNVRLVVFQHIDFQVEVRVGAAIRFPFVMV